MGGNTHCTYKVPAGVSPPLYKVDKMVLFQGEGRAIFLYLSNVPVVGLFKAPTVATS